MLVYRCSLDHIFRSSPVIFFATGYSPIQYRVFNVKDVKVVFCHLFHCMCCHIILSESNLLPYPLYDALRHLFFFLYYNQ